MRGRHTILFGRETIDLSAVAQIANVSQTQAIADAILYARDRYVDGERSLYEVLARVEEDFADNGLDILSPRRLGHYALPRKFELAAAINRLRTLRMRQIETTMREN